jgi:hypothetical protein
MRQHAPPPNFENRIETTLQRVAKIQKPIETTPTSSKPRKKKSEGRNYHIEQLSIKKRKIHHKQKQHTSTENEDEEEYVNLISSSKFIDDKAVEDNNFIDECYEEGECTSSDESVQSPLPTTIE